MTWRSFRIFWIFLALVTPIAIESACKGPKAVGLDMTLPSALVETTAWFEVAAYKEASCAALAPMLADGVPEGFIARVAFRREDTDTPKFGDLPTAKYAFAGVARGETCEVLATGCTEVDVGDSDNVSITLNTHDPPTGACGVGASCQAAKCVPANDNADPSVGAGCSLELLGAGPLANPVGGAGTIVSAPAIAPTSDGFIIVYREVDPNGAGARITLLPLDASGGALPTLRPALPEPCATSDETDGVGLVVNGEGALMALAKAPCGGKPQLQLLNFKPAVSPPEVVKFLVSESPTDARVSLGNARASATRPTGSIVVFTEGGVGRIANMNSEKGIVGPNGSFGGSGVTSAWIAANETVLALLAVGSGVSGPAPVKDAGADAGEADPDPEPTSDSTLRLLMLPSSTAIAGITADSPATITFNGVWASIAALGGRVIVMSDGTGPGRSVTYRAFDSTKDTAADTNGFSVEGDGDVTTGDVALSGDRAYFASLKPGGVSLHVFNNATTTLTPLRSVVFGREPRISGINTVRNGRVTVAATDTRVAVAWTTSERLEANDATGGYAVFGCTR